MAVGQLSAKIIAILFFLILHICAYSLDAEYTLIQIEQIDTIPKSKAIAKEEITSTYKKHHYKVLFTVERVPGKSFLPLAQFGPVTFEQARLNAFLYYIGNYESLDEANIAIIKLKSRGYHLARIVEFDKGAAKQIFKEKKQKLIEPAVKEITNKEEIKEEAAEENREEIKEEITEEIPFQNVQETPIQTVEKIKHKTYHVLFRVLNNPNEEFKDLKKLGKLYRETFDDAGNTRYLIGKTRDIDEARKLRERVIKKGYKTVFVVEYIDGSLSKMIED